jgi:Rho-binding antiterminator
VGVISCSDYDYVEIACLYRYPITLTLMTGEIIEGVAADTARDENKRECIKVICADGSMLVVLDELEHLEVAIENPHFTKVSFT